MKTSHDTVWKRIALLWVFVSALAIALFFREAMAQEPIACENAPQCSFFWNAPTQNEDGSELSANEIAGYKFACTSNGSPVAVQAVTGAVQSAQRVFAPGSYTCALITQDIFGGESKLSNTVNFTVPRPLPNAPAGLSVN